MDAHGFGPDGSLRMTAASVIASHGFLELPVFRVCDRTPHPLVYVLAKRDFPRARRAPRSTLLSEHCSGPQEQQSLVERRTSGTS